MDQSEIAQMAKFMAALQGADSPPDPSAIPTAAHPATTDIAEMKTILERFHAAADHVIMEAPYDRELRDALVTEATDVGTRVGSWEIRMHQNGKRKLYDVVNIVSGDPLATDLLLYEAAHGLVRMLNNGGRINSGTAIELLRAEQEYGSRVQDMVVYRHRLTNSPNGSRHVVMEARYGDAKRRAVTARERVCRLANDV